MGPKLRSCLSKYIYILFALLFGALAQDSYAQTILSPGDLAVVTVNVDEPKNFDFIPLIDLEKGTVIHFTDDAWVNDSTAFRGGEGVITFTAPKSISAGTVVSFDASFENGFIETEASYNPEKAGDNLLVYQGDKLNPTFLYGVEWGQDDSWEYSGGSTNGSDIPQGLSEEENTIISLGATSNLQYNSKNGTEGTKKYLLTLLGNESNWRENDVALSSPSYNFSLVDPPIIAFETNHLTVNESDGSIPINVKLVESKNTNVSVDVIFIASASNVTETDINNFSSRPANFSSAVESGATQAIKIELNNDGEYNGKKRAVFRLKNNSTGTLVSPKKMTVEIEDDDVPEIVINEILADPAETTDSNNDGTVTEEDEFIEIINKGFTDIDISAWTFSNIENSIANVQYTFPQGTVIPESGYLILFAGGLPNGSFGGAIIQTTEGGMSLNNSDETLFIQDRNGNTIDQISYAKSEPGESLVRETDSTLVKHSAMPGADGYLISPGTKADGSPFGDSYAKGIRGGEGWRMISSPTQNTSFSDLLSSYRMQGVTGSDAPADTMPSIYKWNEALGRFREAPANMSDEMKAGEGYIVYFFADDKPSSSMPGIQGGFPKILTSDNDENSSTVSVSISVTDRDDSGTIDSNEGWNLLGNPFATSVSAEAVKNALSTVGDSLNANIYIWNPDQGNGNGGYKILDNADTISPYQAFFVKYMGSQEINASLNFSRNELAANKSKRFYKEIGAPAFKFKLELHGEDRFDTYYVEFSEKGNVELDRFDVFKRPSLNPNSINLYSLLGSYNLQKNELPFDLETSLEIPLIFNVSTPRSLAFSWDNIENIPPDWQILLIDKAANREIDLSLAEKYQFNVSQADLKILNHSKEKPLLNKQKFKEEEPRFVLSIRPKEKLAFNENNLPESIKLNPNYPNPFTQSTTVPFELVENADVTLTIWNMIGQKVATLVDGTQEAGIHDDIRWNASNMPSGIYIARLEVAGQVFIRKMTLIK